MQWARKLCVTEIKIDLYYDENVSVFEPRYFGMKGVEVIIIIFASLDLIGGEDVVHVGHDFAISTHLWCAVQY